MTTTLTAGAMTRRLRAARLGVIRSYQLAEGALRVFAYGTEEARAIAAHLIQLGYDAAATGDRVTVTLPEPTVDEQVDAIADEHAARMATVDALDATEETVELAPLGWTRTRTGLYRSTDGRYEIEHEEQYDDASRVLGWQLRIAGEWAQTYRTLADAKLGAELTAAEAPAEVEGSAVAEAETIDYATTPPYALAAKAEQRWRANRALGMIEPRPATSTPAPIVEADAPPTEEECVTVRIRASELRPGDLVVDSLGEVQYATFDVDTADHGGGLLPHLVTIWTAIRDQEHGLPPRINVPADRSLLVSRPVSVEGRELLAALDRIGDAPAFGSPEWALSLLPENRA